MPGYASIQGQATVNTGQTTVTLANTGFDLTLQPVAGATLRIGAVTATVSGASGASALTLTLPWSGSNVSGTTAELIPAGPSPDIRTAQIVITDLLNNKLPVLSGTAAPTAALGVNGQGYLQYTGSLFQLWQKTSGAWAAVGILTLGQVVAKSSTVPLAILQQTAAANISQEWRDASNILAGAVYIDNTDRSFHVRSFTAAGAGASDVTVGQTGIAANKTLTVTGQVLAANELFATAVRVDGANFAGFAVGSVLTTRGPSATPYQSIMFGYEIPGTAMNGYWQVRGGLGTATVALTEQGNLIVPGSLSKASGTFDIDHPLDPLNRDLRHGFVEAPRYDLIYRGIATLVAGKATIDIDAASSMTSGTFAALTTNAVVTSLQNQFGFARLKPGAITGGTFEIDCEDTTSTDTVSWVVMAERNDPWVRTLDPNTHHTTGQFIPEKDKPE